MTDKLTNPVSSTLDDAVYTFIKLTALHTGTDNSAVIRGFLVAAYEEKMRDLNVYQPLLISQK